MSLGGLLAALGAAVRLEPAPYDVLMAMMLVVALAAFGVRWARLERKLVIFLGLLVLGNLISLRGVPDFPRGIWYSAVTFYLIASAFFLTGFVQRKGRAGLTALLLGYTLGAVVSAGLSAAAVWGWIPLHWAKWGGIRAVGYFKDPNVFAPFLILPALQSLSCIADSRWRGTSVGIIACALLTAGIVLSFSRAAWLGYAAAVGTFLILPGELSWPKRLRVAVVQAAVTAVVILYTLSLPPTRDVLLKRMGIQPYDADRFATQVLARRTAFLQPLGIGPGQAEVVFEYATHNLYLRVLVENGWAGFAGLVGLLVLSLLMVGRAALLERGGLLWRVALASLCGLLVTSCFIDSLHWRHLWFVLALVWSRSGLPPSPTERRKSE